MTTACPFCGIRALDLIALASHLQDDHPGREQELVVALAPELRFVPIFECDIDAVHRSRAALSAVCC
jgi:hypothetical protein